MSNLNSPLDLTPPAAPAAPEIPDEFLDQAATIAERAGREHGVYLPYAVAREIARAVLQTHDTVMTHQSALPREQWEDERAREHYLAWMREGLARDAMKAGMILIGPPTQTLTYRTWRYSLMPQEVPAAAVERGAHWDEILIRLDAPARAPQPAPALAAAEPEQEGAPA
ncbi:hypothetical protein ACQP25_44425 (plasmid) [Microtetraspora malaysiensis]|uniref:hypothetical protein n=1 Tax=Microtetraspora malaysiensis TaxID=161358 RepID=UPI003D8D8568